MGRLPLGCNPNNISKKEAVVKGEIMFVNTIEKHPNHDCFAGSIKKYSPARIFELFI